MSGEAGILIANCEIVDPASGTRARGDLGVRDGVVCSPDTLSDDAIEVDGRGLFAIPGLIDMHVHATTDPKGRTVGPGLPITQTSRTLLALDNLATALHAGVTSVRDLGAPGDLGFTLKDAWQRGMFVGARPLVAGPVITAIGGHGSWLGEEVDGPDSVRARARRNLARGADVIKLMMRSAARRMELRPDELREAVKEAHWVNVPVAVHANFSSQSIDAAVEAGCDTVEHGFAISPSTARSMAAQGTALCSTATALQSIVNDPESWIRRSGKELVDRAHAQFAEAQESFRAAVGAGVSLIAGTDAGLPGVGFDSLVDELETMVEWGASNSAALAAATSEAAKFLRRPDLGSLAEGASADLVLLRADPLQSVSACREVEVVIQRGVVSRIESTDRAGGELNVRSAGTLFPD